MYFALAILIISFLGIITLVGWKTILINKGKVSPVIVNENPFKTDIENIKKTAKKNTKKYSFLSLFALLRFYILSAHYLKKKSLELAKKIENKLVQSQSSIAHSEEEKKEVNKHLRAVSDYIERIRGKKNNPTK